MKNKNGLIQSNPEEVFSPELLKKVQWDKWADHPGNPIINPPFNTQVVGEPTIIMPETSPDGKWHLYAVSGDTYINHMVSNDGINWKALDRFKPGWNPFVFKDKGTFYMFHHGPWFIEGECCIAVRSSKDLKNWTKDEVILRPGLPWEKESFRSRPVVRNACITKTPEGYRLYYASGEVLLPDCGYEEPVYNGVAFSNNIMGPYKKHPLPVIGPNPDDPYRNMGAGGLKVYYEWTENIFLGFNNGIYKDKEGSSRSAIHFLLSKDGMEWYNLPFNPIIAPEKGWKDALVYQLDMRKVGNELWIWYNARDGWETGIERVGISRFKLNNVQGAFPKMVQEVTRP